MLRPAPRPAPRFVPHGPGGQRLRPARPAPRSAPRHAPRLTHEQHHVLRTIARVGQRRHASFKEIKAAVETGLVESNLRNLRYGDADSRGWRQERAGAYPNPTNLTASVGRFFSETHPLRRTYPRAGDLAAAVQRPAAQYRPRYQARATDAESLLAYLRRLGVL